MEHWSPAGPNAGFQSSGPDAGQPWADAGPNAGFQTGGHQQGGYKFIFDIIGNLIGGVLARHNQKSDLLKNKEFKHECRTFTRSLLFVFCHEQKHKNTKFH